MFVCQDKIRAARAPLGADLHEHLIAVSQTVPANRLRAAAAQTPVPPMLRRIEQQMLGYVNRRQRLKYPALVQAYMADVHAEYNTILRAYSQQQLVRPLAGDYVPPRVAFHFRRLGRTAHFKRFRRNRELVRKHLFIVWPFIRAILHYAIVDFPAAMHDFGAYRLNKKGQPQRLELTRFEVLAEQDLGQAVLFLSQDWYPKMVRIIKKSYRRHVVPRTLWPAIFECAKGLINRQLTDFKIRTFQHIREVLLDRQRIPFLQLLVRYNPDTNNIDIVPDFHAIYETYCGFFADIASVCGRLPLLELSVDATWQMADKRANYLPVHISAEYMAEAERQLRDTMRRAYADVLAYLEAYRDEYRGLFGGERHCEVLQFLQTEHTYDEYLAKIEEFRAYDRRLSGRIENEIFDVAAVNEAPAIKSLREHAMSYVSMITVHMVRKHQADTLDICGRFEAISERALEIPLSTEMLLANGEYMLRIKTKDIFVLQAQIQESLRVSVKILVNYY